jgi:hypothetical protein
MDDRVSLVVGWVEKNKQRQKRGAGLLWFPDLQVREIGGTRFLAVSKESGRALLDIPELWMRAKNGWVK